MYDLIVVGAGPCGCMAAIQASKNKNKVLLLEQNDEILKKFSVSGNGRCNLTNNKDLKDFLNNLDHPKPLYSIVKKFSPQDIISYFSDLKVELKEEDHNRIFPVSDKSSTLVNVLQNEMKQVNCLLKTKVLNTSKEKDYFIVETNTQKYKGKNLLLATGGKTIKELGNNIKNYNLVKSYNHTITPLLTQECPIVVENPISILMGISLNNIKITIKDSDKIIDSYHYDILFTHFGLSGPGILNSSFAINQCSSDNITISLELIDNYENTKKIIYDYLNENPTKYLKNLLEKLLPKKLANYLIEECEISAIKNAQLNKKQIKSIINLLSDFSFKFKKFHQPDKAFLTGGGVNLKEINLKTLESKIISNLYIGGELLDICGRLGGYNITIALACGYTIGNEIKPY